MTSALRRSTLPGSGSAEPDERGGAELRFYRILSVLAVVLIPAFGAVYRRVDPSVVDPMWARLLFAVVPLAVLVGTYVSARVRRRIVLVWRGLMYTITTWFVGLCVLNQFSMLYVLGLLYVVTVTGTAFHVGTRRSAPFVTFMAYSVGIAALGLWVSPAPEAPPYLVVTFVLGVALIFVPASRWRIRMEEAVREARDSAREASELKSALLTNMSHEVRTPLTAIMGFAELLDAEVGGEASVFVQKIRKGGRRLLETLDTVIDLAQLEAGVMRFEEEPVDLARLVRELAERYRSRAEERGLDLELALSNEDLHARADRGSLSRILEQLLDNAIKFTEQGIIRLFVRTDEMLLSVVVEDTGRGMEPEFLDRAFLPFAQASTGTTRTHEGTGLGLTLVHRLTEAMDGKLDVETVLEEGSRFTIWLGRVSRRSAAREGSTNGRSSNGPADDRG